MDLMEFKQVQNNFKRHPWETVRLEVLTFFLSKFQIKNKLIIDIGSGDAFIAKGIANQFPETLVFATDHAYTPELIETLKDSNHKNLALKRSVDEIDANIPVAAVVMMDVLEHIKNPNDFLIHLLIKPALQSANFIVTVPAYQILFSKHDENLGHHKRYSVKQLEQLFIKNGFVIKNSGYFFTSLFFVRLFQKFLKIKIGNNNLYNWNYGTFITKAVHSIFWIEFKISWYLSRFGIKISGLTCYCICSPLP